MGSQALEITRINRRLLPNYESTSISPGQLLFFLLLVMKTIFPFLTSWSLALLLPSLVASSPASQSPSSKSWRLNKRYAKRWSNDTGPSTSICTGRATCSASGAQATTAPFSNPWSSLTDVEAASVAAWLFSQESFNLTVTAEAGDWDNTVCVIVTTHPHTATTDQTSRLAIEIMPPNKTDVLKYLEDGGPAPARYAHVTLNNRATLEPHYQDLLIGPLPVTNSTMAVNLSYPYTRKTSGKIRNLDADQDNAWNEFCYGVTASILDITLDLWNASVLGLDNDTAVVWGIDPLMQDDGIIRWDQFWNNPTTKFDSGTLLPMGLYFMSNITGRDPAKWTLDGWLYNDIFYATTDEFRAAYYAPGFEKLPNNLDGSWAWSDQEGKTPALDSDAPPRSVAPSGSRYFADSEQQYVKWMDFEFYLSFSRDTGVHLHNIKVSTMFIANRCKY